MQTQNPSVSDKARNSLTHIAARYQGETGLPARDFPILQQCTANILAAIDEGVAAAARVTELETKLAEFETNLKDRDDKYAVLTGELDQLKAEIESLKRDAISDVVSSTYTPEVHEKFRDAAALVADDNEYAKQDCMHLGGIVKDGARMYEKDGREHFEPKNDTAGKATQADPADSRHE